MRRTLGIMFFLTVVIGVWSGVHYLVYANLARAGMRGAWLAWAIWALALLVPASRFITLRWRNAATRLLYSIAVTWIGLVFLFFCGFLVASLLRILFRGAGWGAALDPGAWAAGAALTAVILAAWGYWRAARGPREVHFSVDRRDRYGLGRELKLVQISDVHLGLTLGMDFLASLVKRINALEPDLVLITGDLLDPEFPSDAAAGEALAGLKAREGVFAVTGNHEFYTGLGRFQRIMDRAGITVLANETKITASGMQVSGIHDPTANGFRGPRSAAIVSDMGAALAGVDPAHPSILLAHQPRQLEPAVAKEVDLILSGHTHNGQIFPFALIVRLSYRYLGGRYPLGPRTDLIVNHGTGFWGPPMRIGSDSQIVVVGFRY